MICQKCTHEWNGKLSVCPACGFSAAQNNVFLPTVSSAQAHSAAKLTLKKKEFHPQPVNERLASTPVDGTPTWDELMELAESHKEVNTSEAIIGKDVSLVEVLTPKETAGTVDVEAGGIVDDMQSKASQQQIRPARKSRKTVMELALLITLVGTCLVTAGFCPPYQIPLSLEKDAVVFPARNEVEKVLVNFTNTSEIPLIMRIDNQLIALDKGQSMKKKISKGLHDMSWWCEVGEKKISKNLPKEFILANACWDFEVLPKDGEHVIVRTKVFASNITE